MFHREYDGVGLGRAVLRRYDDAGGSIDTVRQNGRLVLVVVAFGAGDGWQRGCANRQFVGVIQRVRRKSGQQRAVQVDAVQGGYRRFGGGEYYFVDALRTAGGCYCYFVGAVGACHAAGVAYNCLITIAFGPGDGRQCDCAKRQVDVVGKYVFGVPAGDGGTVDFQIL